MAMFIKKKKKTILEDAQVSDMYHNFFLMCNIVWWLSE